MSRNGLSSTKQNIVEQFPQPASLVKGIPKESGDKTDLGKEMRKTT